LTEVKKFGPVWFLPGQNRGRYPFCNAVYVEGEGIVFDPAQDREKLVELKEGPGINEVWLSHWHEDHITFLNLFEGLPLKISEHDVPPLGDLDTFLDWYGMDIPDEREIWKAAIVSQFNFKPRTPTHTFSGHEVVKLDNIEIEIIPAPGHTPGHTAFFFRGPDVLFMGDYDLTRFGPWYGDVAASIEDIRESVNALRKIPAKVWITGHEDGLFEEEPGELWDSYLAVMDEREEKLVDFLTEPRTLQEIADQYFIYGKAREPKSFFEFGERALMKKHLESLSARAKVQMDGDKYVLI
jgi:hydroxyacylglutathione hydrolase